MATLYTPQPQQGSQLDWLGGMVRDAQQLWQNQARIKQQSQALQQQAQQQQMAEQHFWENQARLRNQEDFQNRKFLYEMKKDEQDYSLKRDQFNAGQDPNSPQNQYYGAQTQNLRANAEQTGAETRDKYGVPVNPKVTTWWYGETGGPSDFLNAFGKGINKGYVDKDSLALSPDQEKLVRAYGVKPGDWLQVKLDDNSVVDRRWDDRTSDKLTGRWDFHGGEGPDPRDGKGVAGFKIKDANTDFIPVGGQRIGGRSSEPRPAPEGMVTTNIQTDPQGRVISQNFGLPRTGVRVGGIDPLDRKANEVQDNLRAAQSSLRQMPSYPTGPADLYGKLDPAALTAYNAKVKAVEEFNKQAQAEVDQLRSKNADIQIRQRLRDVPFQLDNLTDEYKKEVGPAVEAALKSQNPSAVRAVRPRVQALAAKGDPTAQSALEQLDAIIGIHVAPASAPKKEAQAPADIFKK